MDTKVSIKLKLKNKNSLFSILGNCSNCGEEFKKNWEFQDKFTYREWRAISGEDYALQSIYDKDGIVLEGKIKVLIPLCEKDFKRIEDLKEYKSNVENRTIGISIVLLVIYFAFFFKRIVLPFETNGPVIFFLCCFPIFLILIGIGVSKLIQKRIDEKNFKEQQIEDFSTLHPEDICGVKISMIEEAGMSGNEVVYWLGIDFAKVEVAKRFVSKYPNTIITKGKQFLQKE